MSIADPLSVLKMELQQTVVPQIIELLTASLAEGRPLHEVEHGLWDLALEVGRRSLSAFLASHGTGDLGETLTLPEGREVSRLEGLHPRRYVSIFGTFQLQRAVYGSREGQALEFVPLDNRLQLPRSVFSYVLQDWDQSLAMEQPFGQVNQTIARMLRLTQSVDSLEGVHRQMAQEVGWFRDLQGSPPAAQEGHIVVVTADCKGIVIRGQGTPTVCGGERPAGQRANQKRMATVGAVYTVEPYRRTADDVVAALFRDPDYEPGPRPAPCHKRIWASLPREDPEPQSSIEVVFAWLWWEFAQRNPHLRYLFTALGTYNTSLPRRQCRGPADRARNSERACGRHACFFQVATLDPAPIMRMLREAAPRSEPTCKNLCCPRGVADGPGYAYLPRLPRTRPAHRSLATGKSTAAPATP